MRRYGKLPADRLHHIPGRQVTYTVRRTNVAIDPESLPVTDPAPDFPLRAPTGAMDEAAPSAPAPVGPADAGVGVESVSVERSVDEPEDVELDEPEPQP